ncbi:MAG: succinate dehydrogenase [Phycisphaera sp.]|nr:succinate dehydrogenase [Phycisphaera sp.]
MSEHATTQSPKTSQGFLDKHHFLLRRLHSLSGIVPVGLFVCMHLFTNFQLAPALVGKANTFQHEVEFIHSLPALVIIEVSLWLGIGFHAALGLVYTFTGKANVKCYSYMDNVRYTLQRVTGILALIFIFLHIATLRWRWNLGGWFTPFFVEGPDGTPLVAATTAHALQGSALVLTLYIVGVFSVVYHWANGLWTAAITWGLTVSVQAQKRWGYVCLALGLVLAIFSAGAIGGALRYPISEKETAAYKASVEHYKQTGEIFHGGGHTPATIETTSPDQ